MLGWLLLLFTVVPALEIALFLRVGGVLGVPGSVGLVLLTGIVGASLARAQGLAVLLRVQQTLGRGELPSRDLLDGALVLVGGVLLLTPGFLTDCVGLSLLLPPSRALIAAGVLRAVRGSMQSQADGSTSWGGFHVRMGPVMPGDARHRRDVDPGVEPTAEDGPSTFDVRPHAPSADTRTAEVSRPDEGGARVVDAEFHRVER